MARFRVVIRFGGRWDGKDYTGGSSRGFMFPDNATFEDFQSKINTIMNVDTSKYQSRILFVFDTAGVELVEIVDQDSYEFMKDDEKYVKVLNVETVERNDILSPIAARPGEQENNRGEEHNNGGEEDSNGRNYNYERPFEQPRENDNMSDDDISNYNDPVDVQMGAGPSSRAQTMPDPSSMFRNYDWSTEDNARIGSNEIESVPPAGAVGLRALFFCKKDLVKALGLYALEHRFDYKVTRSDKGRFTARCKQADCAFKVSARSTTRDGMWIIYEFSNRHSCQPTIEEAQNRNVSAATIGCLFAPKVIGAKQTSSNVMQELQHNYGVQVGYTKAWRGLECAKDIAYGTPEDSYTLLPSYLQMLERANPGTITHYETVNGHFWMSFCALGASIDGFKSYMRPVIVVDATHLTGVYKGKIYAAVCADGKSNIFPLALTQKEMI